MLYLTHSISNTSFTVRFLSCNLQATSEIGTIPSQWSLNILLSNNHILIYLPFGPASAIASLASLMAVLSSYQN